MTKPATFRDLIDVTFQGRDKFSAETGIEIGHVDVMKHRGSIAADHWPAIVAASDRLEYGVTLVDLTAMRAEFKRRQKALPPMAAQPLADTARPGA